MNAQSELQHEPLLSKKESYEHNHEVDQVIAVRADNVRQRCNHLTPAAFTGDRQRQRRAGRQQHRAPRTLEPHHRMLIAASARSAQAWYYGRAHSPRTSAVDHGLTWGRSGAQASRGAKVAREHRHQPLTAGRPTGRPSLPRGADTEPPYNLEDQQGLQVALAQ